MIEQFEQNGHIGVPKDDGVPEGEAQAKVNGLVSAGSEDGELDEDVEGIKAGGQDGATSAVQDEKTLSPAQSHAPPTTVVEAPHQGLPNMADTVMKSGTSAHSCTVFW